MKQNKQPDTSAIELKDTITPIQTKEPETESKVFSLNDSVLAVEKEHEKVKVHVLKTLSTPPFIGPFNWRFEIGDFKEGMEVEVPKFVAERLQESRHVIIRK